MIEIKDNEGNVRWISVFPFNSLDAAHLYVKNSSVPLKIVKGKGAVYWVCASEDAKWAIKFGYEEMKDD